MKKNKNNLSFMTWLMQSGHYDNPNDNSKYCLAQLLAWKYGQDPKQYKQENSYIVPSKTIRV